jgi:hypothetical protein
VVEAGGQLGQGAGGLLEDVGGLAQVGLEPGAVGQEGLAGRAAPGSGDDLERGRPSQPSANIPQGGGHAAHPSRARGQGGRLPRRTAHRRPGAGDGGWCGIGGSSRDDSGLASGLAGSG